MKNCALSVFRITGLLLCLFLQASSSAQTTVVKDTIVNKYPSVRVNPSVPVQGKPLTLDVILGINPDGCVPKYTTSIETSVSKSNPPIIQVYLNYTEVPFNRDGMGCITVLTSYGPSFDLGAAVAGTYKIYLKDSLLTEFRVGALPDTTNPAMYPYSVMTPQVPEIGDSVSVKWLLGENSNSCVNMFKGKIISHEIQESYPPIHVIKVEYEEQPVVYVWCEPKITSYGPQFDLGKVETGTYLVYNKDTLVTKFFVGDTSTLSKPLRFTPVQPVEGDSLIINQILGYGSSSCSPLYTTSYELLSEGNGQYTYKLSYVGTDRSKNGDCTADTREYGPKWVIPSVKAGYYLFKLNDNNYLKVIVNKNLELPTFTNATIKGVVGFNNLIGAQSLTTLAQCTVAVISYYMYTDKRVVNEGIATELSKTSTSKNNVECSISKYVAVTDNNGSFVIRDIPVSVLMGNVYLVAVKGSIVGYAAIPSELKESMNIDLQAYDYKIVADSVKIAESDEIVALFRSYSTAAKSDLKGSINFSHPVIRALNDGIQCSIPTAQNIVVSAFSMNGKLLWSKHQGILPAGVHNFHFAKVSGMVIVKVKGETFSLSQKLKMTK